MKTSVKGTYFYKQDKFIEGEKASMDYSVIKLEMHLDLAIEKELCVKGEWGVEELAILLNKPVSTITNDGTVRDVRMDTGITYTKNKYKTIPSSELVFEKQKSVDLLKTTVREKIRVNLLEPMRLRKLLEVEKSIATSEIRSRSVLNEINAIDAEIVAYNEVLIMLL